MRFFTVLSLVLTTVCGRKFTGIHTDTGGVQAKLEKISDVCNDLSESDNDSYMKDFCAFRMDCPPFTFGDVDVYIASQPWAVREKCLKFAVDSYKCPDVVDADRRRPSEWYLDIPEPFRKKCTEVAVRTIVRALEADNHDMMAGLYMNWLYSYVRGFEPTKISYSPEIPSPMSVDTLSV